MARADRVPSASTGRGPWIDLTVPMRNKMPQWPSDPRPRLRPEPRRASGSRITRLAIGTHTGTHVDGPLHFIEDGAGVDAFPLEAALLPARVVAAPQEGGIPAYQVPLDLGPAQALLFRCAPEDEHGLSPAHLSLPTARRIAKAGIRLVGINSLSIGGPKDGAEVHRHLFAAGTWIIETLDLRRLEPGDYELLCLPLRIEAGDGAPARVLARRLRPDGPPTLQTGISGPALPQTPPSHTKPPT